MLKMLLIASFTTFGSFAAFAMPTLADNEEITAGDDESDFSIEKTENHVHGSKCGCDKEKGKGSK